MWIISTFTFLVFLQSPYGDLFYTAVGNSTVLQYFGVNENGGLVSLKPQWQYPDRSENIFLVSDLAGKE